MSYYLMPLINGKAYEWADISIMIGGIPMTGATAIEYGDKQNMQNIYAAGKDPNARTYGNVEPFAKISLLMSTVEAIQASAPNGRIQDIPEFDIPVNYIDTNNTPVTHVIKNVRFTDNQRKSEAGGSDAIIVEIELICSHIKWK